MSYLWWWGFSGAGGWLCGLLTVHRLHSADHPNKNGAYILKGWQNVKQRPGVCWMMVLKRVPCRHVRVACVATYKASKDVTKHSERISACFPSILPALCSSSAPWLLAPFFFAYFNSQVNMVLLYHYSLFSALCAFFLPSCYLVLDIAERLIRNNLHLCRQVGSGLFLGQLACGFEFW